MCEVIPPRCARLYEIMKEMQKIEGKGESTLRDYSPLCHLSRLIKLNLMDKEIAWVTAKLEAEKAEADIEVVKVRMDRIRNLMQIQEELLRRATVAQVHADLALQEADKHVQYA